jgi:hypothetical protein
MNRFRLVLLILLSIVCVSAESLAKPSFGGILSVGTWISSATADFATW